MITTLLIGSMFLVLILISVLALHINMKAWIHKMDEINRKRFEELSKRVDDMKTLFVKEVKKILDTAKDIIN